jgi:hypothetical protein
VRRYVPSGPNCGAIFPLMESEKKQSLIGMVGWLVGGLVASQIWEKLAWYQIYVFSFFRSITVRLLLSREWNTAFATVCLSRTIFSKGMIDLYIRSFVAIHKTYSKSRQVGTVELWNGIYPLFKMVKLIYFISCKPKDAEMYNVIETTTPFHINSMPLTYLLCLLVAFVGGYGDVRIQNSTVAGRAWKKRRIQTECSTPSKSPTTACLTEPQSN